MALSQGKTMSVASYYFHALVVLHLLILRISGALGNKTDYNYAPPTCAPMIHEATDDDNIWFYLNMEYLDAEVFLCGSTGRGLDSVDSSLSLSGPRPIGCQKANLDPFYRRIFEELGYQQVGRIKAIMKKVGGIRRPKLDISSEMYARLFDKVVGYKLNPPFDPYANSINFLLATYTTPYYSAVGYVGIIPHLKRSKKLVAKLLGVKSAQDASIRALLYARQNEKVYPYGITVAEFTNGISALSNKLAMCGIKDEGLRVPLELGAENRTTSNIISADTYSLYYQRIPAEILRMVYATGNESRPGGFFPCGAEGFIARSFLHRN